MNRLLLAGTAVLALVLTGCGSAAKDANGATGSGEGAPNDSLGFSGQDGSGRGIPGVSGKVAAVSGSTAQVQSQSSQTAVSWTSTTSITEEVTTTASAIEVGSCVMAQPDPTSASAGSSSGSATAVTATTVRIISTSGDCTAGRPGVVRGGPDGPQFSRPSGAPSGFPSGAPRAGRALFGAVGKVTAVRSGGFTVSAIVPTNVPGNGSSSGSSSGSATPTTRTVTVTTTAATKYTTTKKATGSAVKVGQCLTAQGSTSSTGSVAARRIQLTSPVNGQCGLQVFGGRGPGGGSSHQQFSNGAA